MRTGTSVRPISSHIGAFNQMQPISHATRRKSFRI
uniref:Uncharacterized protein n=1 Tax=Myoviridae sp. ctXRl20 TaxID=2827610 RepID=A0A8S5LQT5_9CAUD|nr:MAG TPA: hypothetical protein [Myoviridae sp. ctXRl20]DAO10057.1 MAG TPA: hypothetical protein [Caudoviricetes sp.]DAT54928.1 MAG TPA: hypothetical protein [Caudoviricetes sp.]DAV18363.1 MAG TPA: hypothetical protein [Caudoviricetes sp.]